MSTCWYCCELKNFKHDIKLISIIIKTCLCHFTTSFQTFYLSLIILEDLNGKLFCKMICPMSHVQHYYILFEFYNKFSYLFNKSLGKVQKSKSLSTREHSMTKKFKFLKFSSYLSINRTNERMNENSLDKNKSKRDNNNFFIYFVRTSINISRTNVRNSHSIVRNNLLMHYKRQLNSI